MTKKCLQGTKNVLGAVGRSLDSVKKVVLTSSFAGDFLSHFPP